MKRLIYILLLLISAQVYGQQLPVYSGYHLNKYVLNPAFAGSELYWDFTLQHRSQWVGFDNNPSTQLFSSHSRISDKKSGLGGYVINDRSGVLGNLSANASYAYHLEISSEMQWSFGVSANYTQYKLFGDKITLDNPNDNLVSTSKATAGVFNSGFGTVLYSDYFYVGFSALNLLSPKFSYVGSSTTPLQTHFYVQAGGNLAAGTNGTITPSLILNLVKNNPFSADFRVTYEYVDIFKVGAGYRWSDALIFTAGFKIIDELYLNYSYDLGVSKLAKGHSGSHEVLLSYNFYYNPLYGKDKKRYNLKRIPKKTN